MIIRSILLSKLHHANIFFAFCFPQTQSEKNKWGKNENEIKKGSAIHASQSPAGYYLVLNCELQTQAVLKGEQKGKADGFLLHPVTFSRMNAANAAYAPFSPAGISRANDPFSVILREILDPHPPSCSRGLNTHTQEQGKELPKYFHQSKSLGLHRAHLHRNPTGPRPGVTVTPLLLLLIFFRLWMFFQQTLLLMGGKWPLLYVTWEKECEGGSYTE